MNKTDYILLDTKGKTQKANNLQVNINNYNKYNKDYLFDFSLLEKHISDPQVLTEIKNQCYTCNVAFQIAFVHKQADIFTSFDYYHGTLIFKPFTVYSNSKNKRVYVIMKLVKIENFAFQHRTNIYNEFDIAQEINDCIGHDYYTEDVEIA